MNLIKQARRWLASKIVGEDVNYNGWQMSDLELGNNFKDIRSMVWSWWYRYERLKGGNQFNFMSDSRARDVGRMLVRYNTIASGIITGLRMYVIGDKGMTVECHPKSPASQVLADQALAYIDAFRDREDWWSRQRELHERWHRDGEFYVRIMEEDELCIRMIEPEYIVPLNAQDEWSFGLRNRPGDVETIEAVHVQYRPDFVETVDIQDVIMAKANVDRAIKRGLSDFASTAPIIESTMKTLKNMITAEGIRQAITYITQHPNSSPDDVAAFVANQTNYVDAIGGAIGSAVNQIPTRVTEGVGEIHLPGQQELASAPAQEGIVGAISAINAALLAVGARYHMPQWLINGDASRNNAIDLGAESPFGKYCADEQFYFSRVFRNLFWRIVAKGVERGDLDEATLDEVDVIVKPQSTFNRDPNDETERMGKLAEAGLLSDKTWSAKEGLDYDTEQEQIKAQPKKANLVLDEKQAPPLNGSPRRGTYLAN